MLHLTNPTHWVFIAIEARKIKFSDSWNYQAIRLSGVTRASIIESPRPPPSCELSYHSKLWLPDIWSNRVFMDVIACINVSCNSQNFLSCPVAKEPISSSKRLMCDSSITCSDTKLLQPPRPQLPPRLLRGAMVILCCNRPDQEVNMV